MDVLEPSTLQQPNAYASSLSRLDKALQKGELKTQTRDGRLVNKMDYWIIKPEKGCPLPIVFKSNVYFSQLNVLGRDRELEKFQNEYIR